MTLQRAALWAIVVAATVYLLVAGRGLLLPFVLGLTLWYMIDALADVFETPWLGIRMPRPVALLVAILLMGGLVWILGRTIRFNIAAVAAAAPTYEVHLQRLIDRGAALVGVEQAPTVDQLFDQISLAATLGGLATAVASVVSVAGIVLIYAGFLFVEQVQFRQARDPVQPQRAAGARALGAPPDRPRHPPLCAHQDHARRHHLGARLRGDGLGRRRLRGVLGGDGVLLLLHPDHRLDPRDRGAGAADPCPVRPCDAVPDRAVRDRHHPDRDGQRDRAGDHGPLAQPLAAGRDRLADGVGRDLGRDRHVPVHADHGGADDRVRALRDDASGRSPALGRRPRSRARGTGQAIATRPSGLRTGPLAPTAIDCQPPWQPLDAAGPTFSACPATLPAPPVSPSEQHTQPKLPAGAPA